MAQSEKLSVAGLVDVLSQSLSSHSLTKESCPPIPIRKSSLQPELELPELKRVGSLKLVITMMYGGKTSYLIHLIETLGYACKILYINHTLDNRDQEPYSTHSMSLNKSLSTRLNTTMIKVEKLSQVEPRLFQEHPVVCIDESQFFPDLDQQVRYMVDILGLEVYVGGLSGDYRRKSFGQTLDLIPDCDDVIMLRDTLCSRCALTGTRKPALFTWRIKDDSQSQIEIGAANYIPVCRGCYNHLESERDRELRATGKIITCEMPDGKTFEVRVVDSIPEDLDY